MSVSTSASAQPWRVEVLHAAGAFTSDGAGGAFTYDTSAVPAGAGVGVLSVSGPTRTRTFLALSGLQPDRAYGAHLHSQPCGALPADAGGHYQQVLDPVQPSTDPDYADPGNEVWLDLHTDAQGAGWSSSTNPWTYRTPPRSLVLHAMSTQTGPGQAGTAGARLACITLH